jgi:hypothetical protein
VAGLAREIVAGSILAVGSTVTVRRAIGMAIGIAGDWVCSTHGAGGDGGVERRITGGWLTERLSRQAVKEDVKSLMGRN